MDIAYMMFDPTDPINRKIAFRRELVFVFLSGLFLGTLAILNILGILPQMKSQMILGQKYGIQ